MRVHTPGKHSCIQLPRVSLHLIPMLIHTPKKVGPTMHIEHHTFSFISLLLSSSIIAPHLNPFGLQYTALPTPLPPFTSPNFINPMVSQLGDDSISSLLDWFLWNSDLVYFYPSRSRYPLRGKTLNVFDGMKGCIAEELPNE